MVVIVAVALALVATPAAAALARRVGLLDRPGPLKVQTRPVPYLGGLAVLVAAAPGVAIARPAWLVPLALALVLGTVDDARTLPPRLRLAGEVVVGLVAGALVPTGMAQPWAALATAIVVVVLINAVNLIDGLDALAAGVSLASAIGFAIALDGDDRTVALALAGALAGFLVYNRPPCDLPRRRRLLSAGHRGAALLVSVWRPERDLELSLGAVLFVAFPVAEVAFAVLRRARARVPLFAGDRGHLYDQMRQRGLPTGATSLVCVGLQAALVVVGLLATRTEPAASGVIVVVTALCSSPRRRPAASSRPPHRGAHNERERSPRPLPSFPEGLPFVGPRHRRSSGSWPGSPRATTRGVLTDGPLGRELEELVAGQLGVEHVVAVSTCTAGLMLVLRALELEGAVVMPSFTFSATAHAAA